MARKRMTLPKKKDDIEKIVEEVESKHGHEHHEHEHHHHHHHEPDLEIALRVIEDLVDALSAKYSVLDSRLNSHGLAIATLFKVVGYLVEAVAAKDESVVEEALKNALEELRSLSSVVE
ncbi:MAG: hypothetical protein F7B20_06445 [Aeropyrum sp.]|nr:hypothetical protein [Aeropyrum sp.]MCE4616318.1 hypothetical protein [Aeropyrum sp.]